MATPISSRQTNRYLGNSEPAQAEVHDLHGDNSHCEIAQIFNAGNAVIFTPDTLEQAYAEGYLPCAWCIGTVGSRGPEAPVL